MALRHFKQRFDANEDFVYIKRMLVGGKSVNAGDAVDKDDFPGGKLKRMWHAQKIALADWKPPQTPGAARIEAERLEAERIEAEKIEAERLEAEKIVPAIVEPDKVAAPTKPAKKKV